MYATYIQIWTESGEPNYLLSVLRARSVCYDMSNLLILTKISDRKLTTKIIRLREDNRPYSQLLAKENS